MIYFVITMGLAIAAAILFVQIQLYLQHPLHEQWCDEWFDRFEQLNRKRFSDPELSWRYDVIERAFHKGHGAG